jgi:protein-disulfide isomerase
MTGNSRKTAFGAPRGLLAPAVLLHALLTLGCGGEEQAGARATDPIPTGERPAPESPRVPASQGPAQEIDFSQLGFDRGAPDAPVKVVELSDFGCGYCRVFALETYPILYEEYIATGKVHWKFVPMILGMFQNSVPATFAAECAGEQGMFEQMHWRLYQDQAEWKPSDDPDPVFVRFAEEEGFDMERFSTCIAGDWRAARVRANLRIGRDLGVRGTPTFFIDGFPVSGALPVQTFRDILEIQLREKGSGAVAQTPTP